MSKNSKINHIEFINDKFTFEKQNAKENIDLFLAIPDKEFINYFDNGDNNAIITLKDNRKIKMSFYDVRASGMADKKDKRIQIPSNKRHDSDAKIIGIYFSGNKNCFITFSKNICLWNKKDSSKSIWIDFCNIYYCLKNNKNVIQNNVLDKNNKINYTMYFSTNFMDIIDIDKNTFYELTYSDKKDIEIKINEFQKLKNIDKETGIDTSMFGDNFTNDKEIEYHKNNNVKTHKYIDENVGKIAESKFNEILENNPDFIKNKLNIQKIYSYQWLNQLQESYQPYDFIINNNIYIDVKGTKENYKSFIISENEKKFREEIIEKGNKYYVVNIINIKNNLKQQLSELDILFFDDEQLKQMDHTKQIKYIYFKGEENE